MANSRYKFRAWDKADKKMRMVTSISFAMVSGRITWINGYANINHELTKYDEIMQYTGLHDKNGKEIYEGDIVNFTYWWFDGNIAESNLCGEVVYLEYCMSFGLKHVRNSDWCKYTGVDRKEGDTDAFGTWTFDEADFEVIGNIYQDSHLLE